MFRAPVLQALIALFEQPPDESILPDDQLIEADDALGYQPVFAQLSFAYKKDYDPLEGKKVLTSPTFISCNYFNMIFFYV